MTTDKINIEKLESGLRLYSIHKATKLLSIGRHTLLTLIANGEIRIIDVLGRKKISLAELLRYTNRNPKPITLAMLSNINPDNKVTMQQEIDQDAINKIFINSKNEVLSYEEEKQST